MSPKEKVLIISEAWHEAASTEIKGQPTKIQIDDHITLTSFATIDRDILTDLESFHFVVCDMNFSHVNAAVALTDVFPAFYEIKYSEKMQEEIEAEIGKNSVGSLRYLFRHSQDKYFMFLSAPQQNVIVSICGKYTTLCARFFRTKWGYMHELLKREFSFTNDEIFQFLTGWRVVRDKQRYKEQSNLDRPIEMPFKWHIDEELRKFLEPFLGHLDADYTTPVTYEKVILKKET